LSVYKRSYKGYAGGFTPTWSRFLILPRFGYGRIFQSKFLITFLVACFFYPMGCLAYVYLANNLSVLSTLNVPAGRVFTVDSSLFAFFCRFQGVLAYLMTAIVGPNLVAPDFANNSMPLYMARPFTRTEYVAGKMSLLVAMLSLITWVPGLLVYTMQAKLAGWDWFRDNLRIGAALFFGQLLWCLVLALLGVALCAWVRWKIAAGALLLGVYFAGAGLGAAINTILRTNYGVVINLSSIMNTIWFQLFHIDDSTGIPPAVAWTSLAAFCGICLWLVAKRVRAFEVVK
jgi:ABC-2 type transport system permease protein